MVLSIINNFSMSVGNDIAPKTEKTESDSEIKKTGEKENTSDSAKISGAKYDSVTISAQGVAYVKNAAKSGEAQESKDSIQQAAVSSDSNDAAVDELTELSDNSEDDSTDDLSEYSDSELKLMMYTGEITRSEYESEMSSRGSTSVAEAE